MGSKQYFRVKASKNSSVLYLSSPGTRKRGIKGLQQKRQLATMKKISLDNLRPPAISKPQSRQDTHWQAGQILKIHALTGTDENGRLLLRIGRQTLSAQAPIKIAAGSHFSAQIQSLGQPPLLKILSIEGASTSLLAHYLRQSLPKSGELSPLLQTLAALSKVAHPLPAPVNAQLAVILSKLPALQQLRQPAGLQAAIRNSGLFLEAGLQQAVFMGTPIVTDFKARLLQLRHRLRQSPGATTATAAQAQQIAPPAGAPENIPLQKIFLSFGQGRLELPALAQILIARLPAKTLMQLTEMLISTDLSADAKYPAILAELLPALRRMGKDGRLALLAEINRLLPLQLLQQQTDTALHSLQAHQLAMLSRDSSDNHFLLLELPILYHNDEIAAVKMQIERHVKQEGEEEAWSVTLNFKLPGLGPLQISTHLHKCQLVCHFQASSQETVRLIREHLPQLHEAIGRLGLTVKGLSVVRTEVQPPPLVPAGHHLVDEQA